jgi:hypothetical protein
MVSVGALAQTPKAPEPPKPAKTGDAPAIPVELREKYFKAVSQAQQAQVQLEQLQKVVTERNTEVQASVAELTKACGDKHRPNIGKDGEPFCEAKPPEPVKPAEPVKR